MAEQLELLFKEPPAAPGRAAAAQNRHSGSAFAFTYILRLRSRSSIGAPPPPSRLSADFPVSGYTALPCSADFSPGRGGLLQLLSHLLVTVPSLPPRRSVVAPPPVCATPCCLRPSYADSASGHEDFVATCAFASRYGPVTRRPPFPVTLSVSFRSSVSLLSVTQATGLWLLPRRVCLPLNAPAFSGRT